MFTILAKAGEAMNKAGVAVTSAVVSLSTGLASHTTRATHSLLSLLTVYLSLLCGLTAEEASPDNTNTQTLQPASEISGRT